MNLWEKNAFDSKKSEEKRFVKQELVFDITVRMRYVATTMPAAAAAVQWLSPV